MDRRSWPWKKKSSDKAVADKVIATLESADGPLPSAGSQGDQAKQVNIKKPKYVQISAESYSHLAGLEDQVRSYEDQLKTYEDEMTSYKDQVKSLEDEVNDLNDKLSEANSEMTTKENLVKQHAKVAEEAVSGWEKAEAEALAFKNQLESVTLLKLTAEDRASHLDGALKECMRQIRNLKEEHEQKLQEVVLNKTKECDMIKLELETQIGNLEQQLLRSASDNAAISRSLQERSNILIKISEEKSQAEADIEQLKSNIDSCEREINSLKYELHIVAKELEIRNEEKNMSVRSAEIANKQHLEGAKKIAKLEAECQRLRGLVRKKLPGPAALAQMKLEVENMGRDYGETRLRRSPAKPSITSPQMSQMTEFSVDSAQKYHKENELLTERLLAMEEETKMLKEALAKRNSELQASRSVCAKTLSKLQTLEAELQTNSHHRSIAKSNSLIAVEGSFSQNASNPPSLTSMSEDGNDDNASYAGSWATAMASELSLLKKGKNTESSIKADKSNPLELMDDFLEMEKLACSSIDSNGAVSTSDISNTTKSEVVIQDLAGAATTKDIQPKELEPMGSLEIWEDSQKDDLLPCMKLQSRISMVFKSMTPETNLERLLQDIRHVVQEMHDNMNKKSVSSPSEESHCSDATGAPQTFPENSEITALKEQLLSEDSHEIVKTMHTISEDLVGAISKIHDFVLLLGKEAKAVHDPLPDWDDLSQMLKEFSITFNEVINGKISLTDFVLCLSQVFNKANELRFNVLGYKNVESEANSSDCVDKVVLPENKLVRRSSGDRYANSCGHFSDSTSDPDIPHEGTFVPTSEFKSSSWNCSLEEFEELKSEKNNLVIDLGRCTENLENTKSQLLETEQLLAEVKSQLVSAQKLNGLAETQLKCMAESYKSLELRAEDLQFEVNLLRSKTESLENELQQEKQSHQDALTRCKSLQEELERIENVQEADNYGKNTQELELAAAAEKLAECQETIFLLGKQLNLMRPQTDYVGSPSSERTRKSESVTEIEPTTGSMHLSNVDMDELDSTTADMHRLGSESPVDKYNTPFSPSRSDVNNLLRSPINSKHSNHQSTKSGSSSSSSAPTPERHARGFSRFFSTKAKNDR